MPLIAFYIPKIKSKVYKCVLFYKLKNFEKHCNAL